MRFEVTARSQTRGASSVDFVTALSPPAAVSHLIEESHGKNVLNLVLVVGYLRKLLDNPRVLRYLAQHQPEIRVEFQKLVESRSLADGTPGRAAVE